MTYVSDFGGAGIRRTKQFEYFREIHECIRACSLLRLSPRAATGTFEAYRGSFCLHKQTVSDFGCQPATSPPTFKAWQLGRNHQLHHLQELISVASGVREGDGYHGTTAGFLITLTCKQGSSARKARRTTGMALLKDCLP